MFSELLLKVSLFTNKKLFGVLKELNSAQIKKAMTYCSKLH